MLGDFFNILHRIMGGISFEGKPAESAVITRFSCCLREAYDTVSLYVQPVENLVHAAQ